MAYSKKTQAIFLKDEEIADFQIVMRQAYNKIVAFKFEDEELKQRCINLICEIMMWEDD